MLDGYCDYRTGSCSSSRYWNQVIPSLIERQRERFGSIQREMVFNSVMLISAAKTSAEASQYMACISEHQRIDGQQMVDLVLCFPLHQLGRLLLYLWTFLCVPPHPTYYTASYYDHNSSDEDDDDDDGADAYASSSSTTFRYVYYNPPTPDDDDSNSSSGSDWLISTPDFSL